jgi:hypothetical protein
MRTTIDFDVGLHKKLKALAALQGISFRQLIMNCVKEKFDKIPNPETLQAMKDGESGQGCNIHSSVKGMLKEILKDD